MSVQIPMIGEKYGNLTVKQESYQDKHGNYFYECECACGAKRIVNGVILRRGSTTGCYACTKSTVRSHGMSGQPIYTIWACLKLRCRAKICERWLLFDNFLKDMDPRPEGYYLRRKDITKEYSKENCFWDPSRSCKGLVEDKQQTLTQLIQNAADTINACYQDQNGEDVFVQFDREDALEQELEALIDKREQEFKILESNALSDVENARSKLSKVETVKRMLKEIMG